MTAINSIPKSEYLIPDELATAERVVIKPDAFGIIKLKTKVRLPMHLAGIMGIRKTWARRGLFIGATIINPGEDGLLEVQVHNKSKQEVEIYEDDKLLNVTYTPSITDADKYIQLLDHLGINHATITGTNTQTG